MCLCANAAPAESSCPSVVPVLSGSASIIGVTNLDLDRFFALGSSHLTESLNQRIGASPIKVCCSIDHFYNPISLRVRNVGAPGEGLDIPGKFFWNAAWLSSTKAQILSIQTANLIYGLRQFLGFNATEAFSSIGRSRRRL